MSGSFRVVDYRIFYHGRRFVRAAIVTSASYFPGIGRRVALHEYILFGGRK